MAFFCPVGKDVTSKLTLEDLDEAWADYKLRGDIEARNLLILHYNGFVRAIAARVAARLPKMIDREDLVSYGLFGLMDALEKYDPTRRAGGRQPKFETYAGTRIHGAIFDEIRGLDWVPRTVRARSHDIEKANNELHESLGRPPTDIEIAEHLEITLTELWTIQSQTEAGLIGGLDIFDDESGDYLERLSVRGLVGDPKTNPEDLFGTVEVGDLLASAINSLPERSKTILVLYYLHEMTLAEIGKILGVTESRVCQLQSKLLQALRVALLDGQAAAA